MDKENHVEEYKKYFSKGSCYEILNNNNINKLFFVIQDNIDNLKNFYTFVEEVCDFVNIERFEEKLFLVIREPVLINISFGDFSSYTAIEFEKFTMKKYFCVCPILLGDKICTLLHYCYPEMTPLYWNKIIKKITI